MQSGVFSGRRRSSRRELAVPQCPSAEAVSVVAILRASAVANGPVVRALPEQSGNRVPSADPTRSGDWGG